MSGGDGGAAAVLAGAQLDDVFAGLVDREDDGGGGPGRERERPAVRSGGERFGQARAGEGVEPGVPRAFGLVEGEGQVGVGGRGVERREGAVGTGSGDPDEVPGPAEEREVLTLGHEGRHGGQGGRALDRDAGAVGVELGDALGLLGVRGRRGEQRGGHRDDGDQLFSHESPPRQRLSSEAFCRIMSM